MAQNRLTMTFLFCPPYDIIILAGQGVVDMSPQSDYVTPIVIDKILCLY